MTPTLDQVLIDAAEDANRLRLHGHKAQADSIDRLVASVRAAAEDYLTWMSEKDAALRSGRSVTWLRHRFGQWQRDGHARLRGGHREYRTLIVPQAVNLISAREAGRAAARKSAA